MDTKNLQIVIALAVILTALSLLLWKNFPLNSESREETAKTLLSYNQIQNLTEVKIRSKEQTLAFQATENQWVVNSLNYTLDRPKLQEWLLQMSQEKLVNLVSNKDSHHQRFAVELSPEGLPVGEGIVVELNQDDSSVKLILGKSRDKGGRYVRYADSPDVYLISDDLSVSLDDQEWIQKELFDVEPSEIKSIQLKHEGETTSWTREEKDAEWQLENLPEGRELKQEVVNELAEVLQDFEFDDLATGTILPQETSVYQATLFDGRSIEVAFAKENDDHYLLTAQMESSTNSNESLASDFQKMTKNKVYRLSSWKAEKMIKTSNDYLQEKE